MTFNRDAWANDREANKVAANTALSAQWAEQNSEYESALERYFASQWAEIASERLS